MVAKRMKKEGRGYQSGLHQGDSNTLPPWGDQLVRACKAVLESTGGSSPAIPLPPERPCRLHEREAVPRLMVKGIEGGETCSNGDNGGKRRAVEGIGVQRRAVAGIDGEQACILADGKKTDEWLTEQG